MTQASNDTSNVGVVIIGRNEAPRINACIDSVFPYQVPCVYVDSGSTDGTVAIVRSRGMEAIELDSSKPFSAARGRNEGFEHLVAKYPHLEYVQFIDGDCQLDPEWLTYGVTAMEELSTAAVVIGRLREVEPDRSIYNRLCDMEWQGPLGDVPSSGGIALIRCVAFQKAGGFDASLIAGEEADLCRRMRQHGWRVVSIDTPMARHDAAMVSFLHWWRRSMRTGHYYAEEAYRRSYDPESQRRFSKTLLWGLFFPLLLLAIGLYWGTLALVGWSAYGLLAARIARRMHERGFRLTHALMYGVFCVLQKFPEVIGIIRYHVLRFVGRTSAVIDHRVEQASRVR